MTVDAATLTELVAAARAAWPTLALDETAFSTWLHAHDAKALARIRSLDPRDVVLAWAASTGDREALALLERHYIVLIEPALRKFGGDRAFVDEVIQRVRVKLLVAPAGELAPLAGYALGGSLAGLLRVSAIREALNQRRGKVHAVVEDEVDVLVGVQDPELVQLKARYAPEFERAFTAAVNELTGQERYLLRLSMSARASIDEIARMFGTHRATAARWLNNARDRLAERTREQLRANLGVAENELTSLLRLIRTEATRMLDSIPPAPDEMPEK